CPAHGNCRRRELNVQYIHLSITMPGSIWAEHLHLLKKEEIARNSMMISVIFDDKLCNAHRVTTPGVACVHKPLSGGDRVERGKAVGVGKVARILCSSCVLLPDAS